MNIKLGLFLKAALPLQVGSHPSYIYKGKITPSYSSQICSNISYMTQIILQHIHILYYTMQVVGIQLCKKQDPQSEMHIKQQVRLLERCSHFISFMNKFLHNCKTEINKIYYNLLDDTDINSTDVESLADKKLSKKSLDLTDQQCPGCFADSFQV